MEVATTLTCQTCFRPKPEVETPVQTQWISVCRCERPYSPSTRFSIDVCAKCKMCVPKVPSAVECPGLCSCARADAKKAPSQIKQSETDEVSFDISALRMTAAHFPLERYTPIGLLGDGSRATVILARDKVRGTKAAVKCYKRIPPSLQANFLNEAKKNQQLNHSNIIKIIDFGFTSARIPYVVTDYKDGFNLEQCLALYGPPSHDVAVKIMHSVCETIMYAQKQGFLHRAIKPGNIIFYDDMNAEPTVFLTDFSLSKDGSSVDLTDLRDALYMTSDEARNLEYSEKSEIYGIGCIGYSLLTGRAPFTDNVSALELKNLHALKLPPRISDIKFDTTRPRDLDELVERCLEKDPSYRFDSISQLADRLQVFPRREQLQAAGALAAKRTNKIMIIAAAIGVPLIICLMLFLAFGTHH